MNKKPQVGVGILLFNDKQEILLGKRIGGVHGDFTWGPPGGHLEYGESLEECAKREVIEETAISINVPKFLALTNDIFEEEKKHYISIIMEACVDQGAIIENCEPHKTEEWKWFRLDALPSPLFPSIQQLLTHNFYGRSLFDR